MDVYFKQILRDSLDSRYGNFDKYGPIPEAVDGRIIQQWASSFDHYTSSYRAIAYSTAKAIPLPVVYSELLADLEGAEQLHLLDIIEKLNINITEIIDTWYRLADKQTNVCVIGYGGMMINMIYIWSQIQQYYRLPAVFDDLEIWEPDSLSFSNCFRLLKSPLRYTRGTISLMRKINLLTPVERKLAKCIDTHDTRLDSSHIHSYDGYTFIGAPDFDTRVLLEGKPFLSCLHSDDKISIISSPVVDSSLTAETYGRVNVNTLFPNIYLASAQMLKILDSGVYPPDTVLWANDFAEVNNVQV